MTPSPPRRVVVVGASAGGIRALSVLVSQLPADLAAALLVVVHVPSDSVSRLPWILGRAGELKAAHASDGDEIGAGRIYVAPPDRHLIVEDGKLVTPRGPRENRHRPAIDPLFRSAAVAYGRAVVAVLLSGSAGDGVAGLQAVKQHGGTTVIQDPEEALFPGLPASVRGLVDVDHTLPVERIGRLVAELVTEPVSAAEREPSELAAFETRIAEGDGAAMEGDSRPGTPSPYGCPECGGVLWEIGEGEMLRFRCRVGHAYAADALAGEQDVVLETVLWSALRALEEKASLATRMSERAAARGNDEAARVHRVRARQAEEEAERVRTLLLTPERARFA